MLKRNKWTHGRTTLEIPRLPTEWHGATACQFQDAVFDPKTGSEVCLLILDSAEYARAYSKVRPFNLYCTSGLVRTSHGVVAYIVWTVAAGSQGESQTEQFLNPHNADIIRLVSALGQQTHMKALVVNSDTGQLCDWFEFENNFGFRDFCGIMAQSIGHEPAGDFQAAMAEVMEQYTTADLLGQQ
jgi:hypothetical protein